MPTALKRHDANVEYVHPVGPKTDLDFFCLKNGFARRETTTKDEFKQKYCEIENADSTI